MRIDHRFCLDEASGRAMKRRDVGNRATFFLFLSLLGRRSGSARFNTYSPKKNAIL